MAQLGSVIGALLAELTRARVIADQLTADLVAEYERNPVLSAMNVPRVTIGEADVTLRYTVDQLVTPPAVGPDMNAAKTAFDRRVAVEVLPTVMARMNADEAVAAEAVKVMERRAKPPGVTELRAAAAGNAAPAVKAATESVLVGFDELPAATRRKIGTKTEFRKELERALSVEVEAVVRDASRQASLQAVLASKMEVSVAKESLSEDPTRVQELTLSIRGDDLDVVLGKEEV